MAVDLLPNAADPRNLTEALRQSGVLNAGRVYDVKIKASFAKQRSLTFRLMLTCEGSAEDAPHSLILKTGHLDDAGRPAYANSREIAFYREIDPAIPARMTPRCFEAREAGETSAWHLLLEDLTDSHFIATEHPLPPTLAQCGQIVQAWARFHAAWWDHQRLGVSVGEWPDAAWVQYRHGFEDRFARFADRFGQVLSLERRQLYERLLDRLPRLIERYHGRRDLTLVHGDAHPWNCFLGRHGRDHDVRLFDWESWSIDIGTTDMAYMMAMLWYPELRQRAEQGLLDLYHAELLSRGVSGYDRQALAADYRLSVLLAILRPIGQAAAQIPARVWWPNLERILLAVDDLNCRELLA